MMEKQHARCVLVMTKERKINERIPVSDAKDQVWHQLKTHAMQVKKMKNNKASLRVLCVVGSCCECGRVKDA